MNRFDSKHGRGLASKRKIFSLIFFVILMLVFLIAVRSVSSDSLDRQQESLETALQRDISHCYAVEGTYPPSLDYMKEHYGLTYDEELFFVDYSPIGSNLRPDVTIIRKR